MKLLSQCQFNFAESRSYSASGGGSSVHCVWAVGLPDATTCQEVLVSQVIRPNTFTRRLARYFAVTSWLWGNMGSWLL
eukprot:5318337-Amphidinium_carterae.1